MATTPQIRRLPSLASQVYDSLRAEIVGGRLPAGGRVVVERVAAQLGVSPTPVREALARLLQEGVICEATPGRLQVVPLTSRYVTDTFLVRSALEGLAAELAAPCITAAQLDSLREALKVTATAFASGDATAHGATDALLHRTICAAAGNGILARELGALQIHVDFIRSYAQRRNGEHQRRSHEEHVQLLDAFVRRDLVAARNAMERHIRDASARIVHLINFDGVDPD